MANPLQLSYYPFGMNITALSSTAPMGMPNRYNTFQGQERIDDFDLGWVQFKWRNHDPAIGRFFNIDPLAESFYYNSAYAFSENKVTSHIELEGLEAVSIQAEFRGAVPVAWAGVTSSGAIGLAVGTSEKDNNIYAVPYLTLSLGVSGGSGVSAGITVAPTSGDIEDLKGWGANVGGFISAVPNGSSTGFSGELNFTSSGDAGLTFGLTEGFSAGGAVYAEGAYTFFLTEPFNSQDLADNKYISQIADALGIAVDEVQGFIDNMQQQVESRREENQRQKERLINDLLQQNVDDQIIIKSDNTRVVNNRGIGN